MAGDVRAAFDAVIVGGGIAGNALATVLARAGKSSLVLERSAVYRDQVRASASRGRDQPGPARPSRCTTPGRIARSRTGWR